VHADGLLSHSQVHPGNWDGTLVTGLYGSPGIAVQ
jgi:hypothetical protein